METNVDVISINGVEYIPKSKVLNVEMAEKLDGLEYVIIRTFSAGVFAGYLKEREGKEVELLKARRIWYWDGAASLSQLSVDGVSKPENCKFAMEVERIILTEAIEILPCTEISRKNIRGVKIWKN